MPLMLKVSMKGVIQFKLVLNVMTNSCINPHHSNATCLLYDIAKPYPNTECNIPDVILCNKHNLLDYNHCVQQNGKKFGFLPLTDLTVYTGEEVVWSDIPDIIEAHKIVRLSARPNFMGARISLNSQLNIPAWKSHLTDYWDKQIVDLLHYGF